MNVFGFNIQTRKQLAATLAAAAAPQPSDDGTPEWIRYAREANRGVSAEMLDTMAQNRKTAARYTRVALYVSIPHQALYMVMKMSEIHPQTLTERAEVIFGYVVALVVPFLLDQAILAQLRTLTTRIASNWSKGRAVAMLLPCVAGSMYLNFASTAAPIEVRVGASCLAIFAAMYQLSLMARADIRKVGRGEQQLRGEIEDALAMVPETPATVSKPAKGQTSADIKRNGERALALAKANPAMSVSELVRASRVGQQRARRILDEVNGLNVPISPLVGPVGAYAGPKA